MLVCAHGNVAEFCNSRGWRICDTWNGKLNEYRGFCRVMVTDREMSEHEYYYAKSELLAKGIELISVHHVDDERISSYLVYANKRRKEKRRVRVRFGYRKENGKLVADPEGQAVIQRIIELRRAGKVLREIAEDAGVRHSDGSSLSISTIATIIKNEMKEE